MNTKTHTKNAHSAINHLSQAAKDWEQRARDAEEGYNTLQHLQQDCTTLNTEFTDLAAKAQALADGLEDAITGIEWWRGACPEKWSEADEEKLAEFRKALDASPGERVARMKAQWQAEVLGEALAAMKIARRDTPTVRALDEAIADVEELRRQAEEGEK